MPNDSWWIEKLPELMKIAATQQIYRLLIAAKNEWNARAARGETIPTPFGSGGPMRKSYLHFENQDNECACGDSKKVGTHAQYACTVRK